MSDTKIGFIGGGNMASSIIAGLINNGYASSSLFVFDPDAQCCEQLRKKHSVTICKSSSELISQVNALVLAVKPQVISIVLDEIADAVQIQKNLVISIAAGVPISFLSKKLTPETAIIRTMPNTPAMISCGATALFANDACSTEHCQIAERIMSSVGIALWVKNENQLDTVTALSGSGPAYFFLVIEALIEAGISLGLEADSARQLALQTGFGATKMALESEHTPDILRQQVTSPGGTTERALQVLAEGDLKDLFKQALNAAEQRAKELAANLDN